MNIFSKLFKKNNRHARLSAPVASQEAAASLQETVPGKDLFVDNEPPSATQDRPRKIVEFLTRNHEASGIHDGYNYHSSEHLVNARKRLAAEFRLLLDQEILDKKEKRLQLQNLKIDVGSVSAATSQKLDNLVQGLDEAIATMQQQKELSIEEEGWVMAALFTYQQGFSRGFSDYLESEALLNPLKTI